MDRKEPEEVDRFELDRRAWNLPRPRPVERPQSDQGSFKVPSTGDDETGSDVEAA